MVRCFLSIVSCMNQFNAASLQLAVCHVPRDHAPAESMKRTLSETMRSLSATAAFIFLPLKMLTKI